MLLLGVYRHVVKVCLGFPGLPLRIVVMAFSMKNNICMDSSSIGNLSHISVSWGVGLYGSNLSGRVTQLARQQWRGILFIGHRKGQTYSPPVF
ncbi:hypothetical protein TNCV_657491 [Trichonephila clavipes]|nr:hypothetical protein TNCV_657491 [Trichonephila clavipes]